MRADLVDFGNGWYEVNIGIKADELDTLMSLLQHLRPGAGDHVQASGDYERKLGISDITLYLADDAVDDNLELLGPPILPTRLGVDAAGTSTPQRHSAMNELYWFVCDNRGYIVYVTEVGYGNRSIYRNNWLAPSRGR